MTEQIDNQFPGASPRIRFWETLRQVMNILVGGLVQGTAEAAASTHVENAEDVRSLPFRLARMTADAALISTQIRALLVSHVYSYARLVEERSAAVEKLAELFQYLTVYPQCVSPGHRAHLEEFPVHRVVCDYVAGMTDAYLIRVHKELLG